jgi:hypothetical protein
MQVLERLKYMLKPAGDIRMKGRAVKAANKNKEPIAKNIAIHT